MSFSTVFSHLERSGHRAIVNLEQSERGIVLMWWFVPTRSSSYCNYLHDLDYNQEDGSMIIRNSIKFLLSPKVFSVLKLCNFQPCAWLISFYLIHFPMPLAERGLSTVNTVCVCPCVFTAGMGSFNRDQLWDMQYDTKGRAVTVSTTLSLMNYSSNTILC